MEEFAGQIGVSQKFAALNRLIVRDLNNAASNTVSAFGKYTKDNIATWLKNPESNEENLRLAVQYIYGASPHFRRLIQYFAGLSDLSYVVSPYKIDPATANIKTVNRNYRKVLSTMSNMNVETQLRKILTVCLREDVFYATMWVTNDSITIMQLPSKYCRISTVEGNVPNVTFDFSYFDSNADKLPFYPPEFKTKYDLYRSDRNVQKWNELDCPTSFAIKCNTDILEYAMPPFAGILREVYDIEDYKSLKMTKTALENYAMLAMKLEMDEEGNFTLDLGKAQDFWRNLEGVLPEEVGSILTPMDIEKISFEKSNTGDTNTVADAEQSLYTAAGVQSLLFNNPKATAASLLLSIKADQSITYGIVKNIEDAINRYVQSTGFGKNFKVTFLDVSPYNRKESGDAYLKAAQYGLPTVAMYAASQGLGQAQLDSMNFLENDVLGLKQKLIPLRSSATMSAEESNAATDEGGAPTKDIEDLSESGEEKREAK